MGIREGFLRGGQQGKCASPQWKGWEGRARQREGHGDVVSLECWGIQAHLFSWGTRGSGGDEDRSTRDKAQRTGDTTSAGEPSQGFQEWRKRDS